MYTCTCLAGYTGVHCQTEINECESDPCQHGGDCTDLVNAYNCTCHPQYEGVNCEIKIDNCLTNNTCQNGATCIDGFETITCKCPTMYTGTNCEKEKSDNFDLFFHGKNGSRSEPPSVTLTGVTSLTVCMWVRYAGVDATGTYLTMYSESSMYENLVMNEAGVTLGLFEDIPTVSVDGKVNDGAWHHECFGWDNNGGIYALYIDGVSVFEGEGFGNGRTISDSVIVMLGQSLQTIGGINQFHGELSRVNVYETFLTPDVISNMATNCSQSRPMGDIRMWVDFDEYLFNDVEKIEPALCGKSNCPPGFTGSLCNIVIDKEAPTVVYCPNNTKVVNPENRLSVVNWTEPVFTDNVGVVNITQNFRPGQVLAYGEYYVEYVAVDAEGNSATCSFTLYVMPFDCAIPPEPINAIAACGAWTFGQYCRVQCTDPINYDFEVFPPPFYKCDQTGSWDPAQFTPFRFPSCTRLFPPLPGMGGSVQTSSAGPCDAARAEQVKQEFITVMRQLDQRFGLCSLECDYSNVKVKCGGSRKKRQADGGEFSTYDLEFDIPLDLLQNGTGTVVDPEIGTILPSEALTNSLKEGNTFENAAVADTLTCAEGQVLNQEKKCVPCAPGSFFNNATSACESCGMGTYNTEIGQYSCTPCPAGTTTQGTGSTNRTECFGTCSPGNYYSYATEKCEQCATGYYQNEAGQLRCKPCGTGATTLSTGATAESQCTKNCGLGTELSVNGECSPCEVGSYKDQVELDSCVKCPYGTTTPGNGASAESDCSVIECPAGKFLNETGVCSNCPRGTYQPSIGQTTCIMCAEGFTTLNEGAVLESQCEPGDKDECELGTDNCDTNAVCENTPGSFVCVCNRGFTGTGVICTDLCTGFCEAGKSCIIDQDGNPLCSTVGSTKSSVDVVGITLGATGAVVAVIFIIAIIIFCMKKKNSKVERESLYNGHGQYNREMSNYNGGYIDDDLGKHPIPEQTPTPPNKRVWKEISHVYLSEQDKQDCKLEETSTRSTTTTSSSYRGLVPKTRVSPLTQKVTVEMANQKTANPGAETTTSHAQL
ncbi:unnamed protein product [Owenia fusiformis]|uniref:Sushi, von Willebrand factor type A, EGF and pentraxin domain-containing protein 1-like n=1 Tax=Owenia fusiformis TaxID=6347 RepID=A0A8S4PP28_OWEFU|nr:unnamed protein product [Owenia fusiformis]